MIVINGWYILQTTTASISFRSSIDLLHFSFKDVPIEHDLNSGKQPMIFIWCQDKKMQKINEDKLANLNQLWQNSNQIKSFCHLENKMMALFTAVFLGITFAKAIVSENNQLFYRFFGLSIKLFTMSSKLTNLFSLFPAS